MTSLRTVPLLAALWIVTGAVGAQVPGPVSDAPALTDAQARDVQRELDRYRQDVQQRLAQGAITPDEAQRLVGWRQWQLAQQAAGAVAPSQIFRTAGACRCRTRDVAAAVRLLQWLRARLRCNRGRAARRLRRRRGPRLGGQRLLLSVYFFAGVVPG
jgi:hypothetical protein